MLFRQEVGATHYMGSSVTYECLGGCSYRVWFKAYDDCGGGGLPPTIQVQGDTVGCIPPTAVTGWTVTDTVNITPLCPSLVSSCDDPQGQLPGVREISRWAQYDFCNVNCDVYTFNWNHCCRNSLLSNGASNASVFIGSAQINLQYPCNSSPQWCMPHQVWIPINQTTTFTLAGHDADGDSLAYRLGTCYSAQNTPITPAMNYHPVTAPLGPNWTVNLDPVTGQLTLTPTPGGQVDVVLCAYIDEFRNGILIESVVRDFHVSVVQNGLSTTQPVIDPPQNVTGGNASGYDVYACLGDSLCFELPSVDPDTGESHTFYWDEHLAGATFTDAANPGIVDTLTGNQPLGKFGWRPTQPGIFTVCFGLRDDACAIRGMTSRQIRIHVLAPGTPPTISQNGDTLTVMPPGMSYQWYMDSTAISGATAQSYVASLAGDYWAEVTDSAGCTHASDTVQIIVLGADGLVNTELRAWPVPASDWLNVSGAAEGSTIRLYDLQGRLLQTVRAERGQGQLNLRTVPDGVYLLRNETKTLRIVRESGL
jgi:hypothetical protein